MTEQATVPLALLENVLNAMEGVTREFRPARTNDYERQALDDLESQSVVLRNAIEEVNPEQADLFA